MKKLLILISMIILLFSANVYGETSDDSDMYTETAIVLEASELKETEEVEGFINQYQDVKLKITSGKYKNQIFDVKNNLSENDVYNIVVEKGEKVVVSIQEIEGEDINIYISDYMRQNYIFYLVIIFILLIIIIGKKKGLKSVVTLAITMFAILKVLLPMILKGANPIPITILISIVVTILTMFIVGGINKKSIAAVVGTSGGVLVAGIIAYYIGSQVKLTGLSSEEAMMLMYIPQEVNFDFRGLLFSGIILGSLGAVMDVGMSIASSMDEIHKANPNLTRKELFKSGMNVGKDVMGTMTNTLILAYTGSSIPVLLLFMAYETSIAKILNLDVIATEAIRSLAGSIGLVLTIPLTALVSSTLIKNSSSK
ncbi:YibE/F family protein [Sporanaerobacter acetigenes]|uniref:Uncharacterized membrane protein n=1 Tax=Sporanaerobacter acetigenes DSM 13106 TaxID=1123281 RepID=A0A1M5X9D4_9FIRM|nr:YibE/F family protein [Sporanaerobacter acetigenes]SHH96134.1 Uncharacterized membrane protein [Sporanaerobacter acetigenes DSM 13106]